MAELDFERKHAEDLNVQKVHAQHDYNMVSAYGHFGMQGLPWEE